MAKSAKVKSAKVKIDEKKSKIDIDNIDLDVVKFILQHGLATPTEESESFELPNIDQDKVSIDQFKLMTSKGMSLNKFKCFVQMKKSNLTNELHEDYPNREKSVLTLQTITRYRHVLAIGNEPKLDENGDQIVIDTIPQTYETDEPLMQWVEDHYIGYKTDDEGVNYMQRIYLDDDQVLQTEEKLYTDLTHPEVKSGQWSPVLENKARMILINVDESYEDQAMLPDLNGLTEPKTYGDLVIRLYEDINGNGNTQVLVFLDEDYIPANVFTDLDAHKDYTLISKKDALALYSD